MKTAFVSTMAAVPWGGSEELWAATARRAMLQGHRALAAMWRQPCPRAQVADLVRAGMRFMEHRPLMREGGWKRRWNLHYPSLANRLGRRISAFRKLFAFKPDVVCFSLGDTYALSTFYEYHLLMELLQRHGVPYMIICHLSTDEWTPTAGAARLTREHFAGAYRVAFVSEANRRLVERQLGGAFENAMIVRNPVNLADASAVAWPDPAMLNLASVARLDVGHKGQDVLAAALADARWAQRPCNVRLYGEGPDEDKVRGAFRERSRVPAEFCGQVGDIRAVWAQNHVLVMPSRMEGTPLAMVEAMLCGRPVVATDVGGITEWVEDGVSGFIAAVPTAAAFADALERMWARRGELEAMGKAARERALSLYDPDPGGTLLSLLEEAAGRGS